MTNINKFFSGTLLLLLSGALAGTLRAQNKGQELQVNAHSRVIQDFQTRIADYLKLHKSLESKLPPLSPTDSPEKILQHQEELAKRIREARNQAGQGDIFTADIRMEFHRLMQMTMQGENGARIHASLGNAEPVQFVPQVNAAYPPGIPLQSSPPTILQNLPKLPPELEYRIVGHQLVLRDVNANLIIDFMAEAIP